MGFLLQIFIFKNLKIQFHWKIITFAVAHYAEKLFEKCVRLVSGRIFFIHYVYFYGHFKGLKMR